MSDDCPNTLPGAKCIDPECTYCRIAEAEQPKQLPVTELKAR